MVARMKIVDLKKEMDARFERVDARLEQVDARFEQVDARFEQVDARLERLERALATEHETTRRHMDVLIEQCRAEIRLALERSAEHDRRMDQVQASNARDHAAFIQWLQDHEVRLTALENPTGSPARPPL
jgi:chromosome segregation ATPase